MCRYGVNSYKPHYACFECRKTFKRKLLIDIDRNTAYSKILESRTYKCPECSGTMADMGLDFKSPKKTDLKAWNHIQNLYKTGITFHSCGCSGPGYIPKERSSLIDFLNKNRDIYIENLRFWSTRNEQKSETENDNDWKINSQFLLGLPSEFNIGTKKKKIIDIENAVEYWINKVKEIEKNIIKTTQ